MDVRLKYLVHEFLCGKYCAVNFNLAAISDTCRSPIKGFFEWMNEDHSLEWESELLCRKFTCRCWRQKATSPLLCQSRHVQRKPSLVDENNELAKTHFTQKKNTFHPSARYHKHTPILCWSNMVPFQYVFPHIFNLFQKLTTKLIQFQKASVNHLEDVVEVSPFKRVRKVGVNSIEVDSSTPLFSVRAHYHTQTQKEIIIMMMMISIK